MGSTRNDSLHITHLLRLAVGFAWLSQSPTLDQRALARHIDLARTLATTHQGDPTAYRALAAQITAALAFLGRHLSVCGDFDHVRPDFVALRDIAQGYLRTLTPDQRRHLAAFQGFEHAHLVEENTRPGGDGALVMWLNPVYCQQTNPHLARVQDAALTRYAERYPTLTAADRDLTDTLTHDSITVIFA
ncbi:hypothetical protein ABT352_33080 [Streptosporangium sp. NPDC000563]|uniref:hypothetical protein n=1 Tax=Streptosporangium sp. NPDC000563 TaxID=3154366 RepID=UPI0033257EC9